MLEVKFVPKWVSHGPSKLIAWMLTTNKINDDCTLYSVHEPQ